MTAISCKNLCKTFTQGEEVIIGLDDVTVDFEEGSFVCLSGPSGSGKTTLLNAMGGLDTPDSGEILVGGKRVDQMGKADLADMRLHNIGFVFQAYNLIPVLTARENIEFVMQVQGVPAGERGQRSRAILEEVGLSGHEDRRPAQLSGGQQQRVAVARAVIAKPNLILADEPTGNLDSQNGKEVMDLLTNLNKLGTTILMVTHSPSHAEYARRDISLFDGEVITEQLRKAI